MKAIITRSVISTLHRHSKLDAVLACIERALRGGDRVVQAGSALPWLPGLAARSAGLVRGIAIPSSHPACRFAPKPGSHAADASYPVLGERWQAPAPSAGV